MSKFNYKISFFCVSCDEHSSVPFRVQLLSHFNWIISGYRQNFAIKDFFLNTAMEGKIEKQIILDVFERFDFLKNLKLQNF